MGNVRFRGLVMRKILTGFLVIVLAASMFLSAAPMAFASESVSEDSPVQIDTALAFVAEPDLLAAASDQGANDEVAPAGQGQQALVAEGPDEPGGLGNPGAGFDFDNSYAAAAAAQISPSASVLDSIKDLLELGQALNELLGTIQKATGPCVVCVDSTTLSEDNLSASFQEGAYYLQIITLVNKINVLLEKCGLQGGLSVSALPISVAESLPDGFSFTDNTLTLTDKSLLFYNEDLGDDPDKLIRSYEVTLFLSTGSPFIDSWLLGSGVTTLAAETFTIDLLLKHPGTVFDPDPGTDPNPDPKPDPGLTDPDPDEDGASPGDGTGFGDNVLPGLSDSLLDEPSFVGTTVLAALSTSSTEPDDGPLDTNENASSSASTTSIASNPIPMASVMFDDEGNLVITNASLVVLSLILALAALVSLRQGRNNGFRLSNAATQLSQIGLATGVVSVGLGAASVILLMLSQYLDITFQNTSIAWTPILISIAIVQVACTLMLLISSRMAEKRLDTTRLKIRY